MTAVAAKPDLSVTLGPLKLKNPVMTASGTFGFGQEWSDFYDLSALGAIMVKAVTVKTRAGNPLPRLGEAPARAPASLRAATNLPLIIKLSPNVTDITDLAQAAVDGGADILSLVNTFVGTAIDIKKRAFKIANRTGGLSGPCIKPLALYMVWRVANAVKLPIIGMGGVSNASDAVEFLLAGASAIATGTINFVNPHAAVEIIAGIEEYLVSQGAGSIREIVGTVR